MSEKIDTLLVQPLPDIADDGFSARVMAEVSAAMLRRSQSETRILAAFTIAATAILPFTSAGRQFAVAMLSLDPTLLVVIAAVAALSYWCLEQATE